MSSDLWAEFGGGSGPDNPWATTNNPNTSQQSGTASSTLKDKSSHTDTFDPWASFEAAPSRPSVAAPLPDLEDEWSAFESAEPIPGNDPTQQQWKTEEQPSAQVANTSKPTESTFNDDGLMWDADSALQAPAPAHEGSLIDISGLDISGPKDEDANDDFGDFEEAAPAPASAIQSAPQSLKPQAKPNVSATIYQNRIETQGPKAANRLIFGAVEQGQARMSGQAGSSNTAASTSKSKASTVVRRNPPPSQTSSLPTKPDEDEWDDFDSLASEAKSKQASTRAAVRSAQENIDDEAWDDFTSLPPDPKPAAPKSTLISDSEPAPKNQSKPDRLPPTNIPPPSILLSLLHTTILPSLTRSTNSASTTNNPNPTLRTAAHILAGRKHRWKRDTHLAQSMSISASAPGFKSGMKLTGVDRSEATREDREAAELVRVFKQSAGALRARALKAGEKGIAELGSGTPAMRTEKGTGAPGKGCVICGLRRAERVHGVDEQVYDGFGEWWIEHWGHRECKEWWDRNEEKLEKR